ncbi:MAG: cytochrome c [Chlorobi bacterium]|nr:cytochrome c [Chlorobiota bacterium]
MKNYLNILIVSLFFAVMAFGISSCVSEKQLTEAKSGAQLWAENCVRCHNTPSPTSYSDPQWDVVGLHMRVRANLTDNETKKIIEFLKSANN